MGAAVPRQLQEIGYRKAAQAYLNALTLENFMESPDQATQRKISVVSLDLIRLEEPDLQTFSELLVQRRREDSPGYIQIVPDTMVVLHSAPLDLENSLNYGLQPVAPFWVFEYVSPSNPRMDYEGSFQKYEQELQIPYCLIFYAAHQELSLFRLAGGKYVSVKPRRNGRLPVPRIHVEVAILDGWVRFWHRGRLIPLPVELQQRLDEALLQRDEALLQRDQAAEALTAAVRQRDEAVGRAEEAERELARLRKLLGPGGAPPA